MVQVKWKYAEIGKEKLIVEKERSYLWYFRSLRNFKEIYSVNWLSEWGEGCVIVCKLNPI